MSLLTITACSCFACQHRSREREVHANKSDYIGVNVHCLDLGQEGRPIGFLQKALKDPQSHAKHNSDDRQKSEGPD